MIGISVVSTLSDDMVTARSE